MSHLMIDLETLGTAPDTTILTIAAQQFDPFSNKVEGKSYYCRVDFESQTNRSIEQGTIDWWASQPGAAKDEAFNEQDRIPLEQALTELGRLIWHSKFIWANGPTFDMTILEHAFKSYNRALPWKYYAVRDARTVYSLFPGLEKPSTSHHSLEDCRRQIKLLQATLQHLNVKEMN